MATVNGGRLIDDLQTLREFGSHPPGVVRPAFSDADMAARHWLAERFTAAGLSASIDGVGNVFGRSAQAGPAVLIGSHSDSQPTGGWLDGALGVIYGLEVARALAEDPATAHLAVDVVSWQDEESRFYGCLGSRSFVGQIDDAALAEITDRDGVNLAAARADAGLADVARQQVEPGRHIGFLEAHIEQGPHLDKAGLKIGVVEAIVALRGLLLRFHGQQNHAGTTMMADRRDAAAGLYEMAHRINTAFPAAAGPRSVWTMGRARLTPNAASIVPGFAELELQFRDADEAVLDRFEAIVQELADEMNARGGVTVDVTAARAPIGAVPMDPGFADQIAAAAAAHCPAQWQRMPSGAFHDASILATVMPAAMMFIPSIGGVSHDFSEDTALDDIVLGAQVFTDATERILTAA